MIRKNYQKLSNVMILKEQIVKIDMIGLKKI